MSLHLDDPGDVEVAVVPSWELLGLGDQLERVYRRAFAGPPWHEADGGARRFLIRLRAHARQPGFRAVVATTGPIRRTVGFAYGFTSLVAPPPGPWYAELLEVLGRRCREEHLRGAFELVELAVVPDARARASGGGSTMPSSPPLRGAGPGS